MPYNIENLVIEAFSDKNHIPYQKVVQTSIWAFQNIKSDKISGLDSSTGVEQKMRNTTTNLGDLSFILLV